MSDERPADAIARVAASIAGVDEGAREAAAARQAALTKPPGSLGSLETLAARIAGITGRDRPRLDRRLIVVAAADHGVAALGVSAYPAEVTAQMVRNFLEGGAAINVLADHAGARLRLVDAGVRGETPDDERLLRLGLGAGTADITSGPAMTREAAELAVAAGMALFEEEATTTGVDIVGCGEMGIGNTTSAAALIAALTGRPAGDVTGPGTGVEGERYAAKLRAVERAVTRHAVDGGDAVGALAALGGFEIGVLAGVYVAAAAARVPAVVDGLISGAAALLAAALAPGVADNLIAAHRSTEPGHGVTLERLGLTPLLDLDMRLGEGTGAALGITLCVAACRLLDEMATFEEAGVSGADETITAEP